jgi:hypothetical protein
MYFEEINHYLITQSVIWFVLQFDRFSLTHVDVAFGALDAVGTPARFDVVRLPGLQRPRLGCGLVICRRLLIGAGVFGGAHAAERASNRVTEAVVGHSVDYGVDGRVRVDHEVSHEPQDPKGLANLKSFQISTFHILYYSLISFHPCNIASKFCSF